MNLTPVPPTRPPVRIALDPERLEQDRARLVLTLIEFLRRLMKAQAARCMELATVTETEAERLGPTLPRARQAVVSIRQRLDVAPETLNLDLGPLGKLL